MKKEMINMNDKSYQENMIAVYELMNKGEANLTAKEINWLKEMTVKVEKYEDDVLGLKPGKQPFS